MKKEEVVSKKSGQTIGPYSQAIKTGSYIFVSGQIGVDPKTNKMGADIKLQTEQAFENLRNVLEAGSASLENVVKVNVYLTDINNFPIMNKIYAKQFEKPYPARATVEVSKLPKSALIEIDCIAAIIDYPPSRKASADKGGCCDGCCQSNCC